MTSSVTTIDPTTGHRQVSRVPHPELHMHLGEGAWIGQPIHALYGMTRGLTNPYLIFYNPNPRAGVVNQCIREIQGRGFREDKAWRGDIVVAKYRSIATGDMLHCTAADFPLIKNYFALHYPMSQV